MSYDALTVLHLRLDECDSIGWDSVINFVTHLPLTSAVSRALHPEYTEFASDLKRNSILADIYDLINNFAHNYVRANSKSGSAIQRPNPYPRPDKQDNCEHIGKDPIPIRDFDKWYYGGE